MVDTVSQDALTLAILEEWRGRRVPDAVVTAAKEIADRYAGHVDGVLFYGSCLRTGDYEDKILDFYVIVDSYRAAYGSPLLAFANAVIPPNVFYHEMDVGGIMVRSKYAVLSRADFHRLVGRNSLNVSVWARFSQPCLVMLARNDKVRASLAEDVAQAVETMISNIRPLITFGASAEEMWVTAFSNTYKAELRSEKGDKGREIYELDRARYDAITPVLLARMGIAAEHPPKVQPPRGPRVRAEWLWAIRRFEGKFTSLARLIKASMTFDGGMDYLAWKIRRHSGVEVDIKPWMRKVPLVGAPWLALSLRMKGAFR